MNSVNEADRRAQRAQRFKQEEKSWKAKTKEPLGPRVAHSGGNITSNKQEALQRFLERKAEKGEKLDPTYVSLAIKKATEESAATPKVESKTKVRSHASKENEVEAAHFLKVPVAAPKLVEDNKVADTKAGKKNAKRAEKRANKKASIIVMGSA